MRRVNINVIALALMIITLWAYIIRDAYDYFSWTRPMEKCADQAQHSPTLVKTCLIGHARVTIISNGLQR